MSLGKRIIVEGVEIGRIEVSAPSPVPGRKGEISVDLTYRPDWVGVFKLQAALAGKEG